MSPDRDPRLTSVVAALPPTVPFVPPESLERTRGHLFRARLGANESVFGPSPLAVEAMRRAVAEVWKYGDPENHELRQAIARHHGVGPENVVVGEGIDGLFAVAARLFVEPGTAVATSLGAYPTFNYSVASLGGRLVKTPYVDDREDPTSLLDLARRERARIVFFANPDNPMGTWWDASAATALIEGAPPDCVVFLDEAYAEFAPPGTSPPIDPTDRRVLRFRTFSKVYGMAGARVGYAIGAPSLIQLFDRVRLHFGVNKVGQVGALAALADTAYTAAVVEQVARARERIGAIARAAGLRPLPSATNFVTVDCGRDGAFARRVLDAVLARGVFIRMPGVAPLDRCVRISAGTDADLDLLAEVFPAALAEAG